MPKISSPWDEARRKPLVRQDGVYPMLPPNLVTLDRGVNFFVLALEKLGATTVASCEGHPGGFYILFDAPYETALQVSCAGYFRVEVERGVNRWTIRLPDHSFRMGQPDKNGGVRCSWIPWTERDKRRVLRGAAKAWTQMLPPEACRQCGNTASHAHYPGSVHGDVAEPVLGSQTALEVEHLLLLIRRTNANKSLSE